MKYTFLAALAIAAVPSLSHAATYHYVNMQGETATVEALNAEMALLTAPNLHPNSGVALDLGIIEPGVEVANFAE